MNFLPRVAVIGAGIVGLAVACRLQREGFDVVVLDPAEPGSGASGGNAGCLSPSSIVPLSGPGVLRQVPGWLRDPFGPLVVRPTYLLRALPWLGRFVWAGRPRAVAEQAAALTRLLAPAQASLRELMDADPGLVRQDGSLIVYRSAEGWRESQRGWALRRANGITWQELDGPELRAVDPALAPGLFRGILLPGNGHVTDPLELVRRLAARFIHGGGRFVAAAATGFDLAGKRLRGIRTAPGAVEAGLAVVAAGAWSQPLARQLGDRLPLEAERGYHLMLQRPPLMPRLPTVAAEDRFVATPMACGLRLTGTVELAGLAAPPDWRRAHMLLPLATRLYPGLSGCSAEADGVWMGYRPSMPDSLPVIGRARRTRDVIYAFGHGHLGVTAAAFTAHLVADLAAGRPPRIDLAPFSPERF